MLAARHNIEFYEGTSFRMRVRLNDLSWDGGPSAIGPDTVIEAQTRIRRGEGSAHNFAVEVLDAETMDLMLSLTPQQTLAMPARGVWDLRVRQNMGEYTYSGVPLTGDTKKLHRVTV